MQLDVIAREGARRMLAAALRAEVAEYLGEADGERDDQGHALVTRNGTARAREVVTVAGAIPVVAPQSTTAGWTTTATGSGSGV